MHLAKLFQVLIGILTMPYRRELFQIARQFQVLIGILTMISLPEFVTPILWFQVLIGILTILQFQIHIHRSSFVSSPYRYSNNLL